MRVTATTTLPEMVLPLRVRYRQEMNCQVVRDSIHRRAGWTETYALHVENAIAGFSTLAMGGPWEGKRSIIEFYVLPQHRARAFHLFERLRDASSARRIEVQSNDALLAVMLHTYARDVGSDSIVFRDGVTTMLTQPGATLEQVTSDEQTREAIAQRQGGPEWQLHLDGQTVGKGGILFHYNVPFGDIYMEVAEPFRRRGLGAYLVQELKRAAYQLGAIPCARCGTDNVASRKTLQNAGFVPYAHILHGALP